MTLQGRTIVVTGASSGIGAAGAVELARRGATVVPIGRDATRLSTVAADIRQASGQPTEPQRADFASLDDVRELAERLVDRHERIDILINNAGLRTGRRALSSDGHELTFQVNHLAPFLLTNLLLERMRAAAPGRVVTTGSKAHEQGEIALDDLARERDWSSWQSYADSKLANVLFTREFARRIPGDEVVANCFDPGVTRTRIQRDASARRPLSRLISVLLFRSPERAAEELVHLAETEEAGRTSGGYFANGKPAPVAPQAEDAELASELWSISCKLTGVAVLHRLEDLG